MTMTVMAFVLGLGAMWGYAAWLMYIDREPKSRSSMP